MATAEVVFKSPFIPLFQRGSFLRYCFNPSLEKRGRGDFDRNTIVIIQRTSDTARILNCLNALNCLNVLNFFNYLESGNRQKNKVIKNQLI
jgi:hypothetical protein